MEISGRRLFVTLFIIGLVSTLTTAATYTWLSDTETISWKIEVKTADLKAPKSITFPDKLAPGESSSVDITVENKGEVTLIVTLSVPPESPWVTFEFEPNDFELNPGESETVTVTAKLSEDYEKSGATLEGTITVYGEQKHP